MIQSLSSSWSFWLFWFIAFLGFPIGGLVANLVVGGVTDLPKALVAGAITGLAVGTAQWLALRSRIPLPVWWIVATAAGMAVGLTISVLVFGTATDGNEILFRALITGLVIGIAQWFFLKDLVPNAFLWIAVVGLAWTVGWFVTRSAGVDISQNWSVFGATGAIAFQVLTGIALFFLLAPPTP